MNKNNLYQQIIDQLEKDHSLQLQAAKSSHAAATHADNIPDSKYETLALEASYIAQGQANRALEIELAMEDYHQLTMQLFTDEMPIRLSALVKLTDEDGNEKQVFLGPAAGGLKLRYRETEILVITPTSPLGEQLIGLLVGDCFELFAAGSSKEYEITDVC